MSMKKYVCKKVEFSPIRMNMKEVVGECVKEMNEKGYRLETETEIGIYSAILVFKAA